MITEEQIARINELAKKSKTEEGLTEAEKEEQKILRRDYIDSFKENLRAQLDNIEIKDEQQETDENLSNLAKEVMDADKELK